MNSVNISGLGNSIDVRRYCRQVPVGSTGWVRLGPSVKH